VPVYALSAFEKAHESCRLLLESCDDNRHPLFSALSTAVHVFYARPFRHIQGIPKSALFQNTDAPPEFHGMHEFLVSFRDKIVAHTDANTGKDFGVELHDVQIKIVPGDFVLSCSDPAVRREAYQEVTPLIHAMKLFAMRRFVEIKARNEEAFPLELGEYVLKFEGDIAFEKLKSPSAARGATTLILGGAPRPTSSSKDAAN
jgi:hypothetical protein